GRGAIDVGPAAELAAEAIADRILYLERGEFEAFQRALLRRDVDADFLLHGEIPRPVDSARRVVQVFLVAIREFADLPEHARRGARPEIRAVAGLPVAAERDPSGGLLQLLSTER